MTKHQCPRKETNLCDCNLFIDIAEGVQLPVLLVDGNVKLASTFQRQLISNEDANRVAHERLGEVKHLGWHGGRQKNDLSKAGLNG